MEEDAPPPACRFDFTGPIAAPLRVDAHDQTDHVPAEPHPPVHVTNADRERETHRAPPWGPPGSGWKLAATVPRERGPGEQVDARTPAPSVGCASRSPSVGAHASVTVAVAVSCAVWLVSAWPGEKPSG